MKIPWKTGRVGWNSEGPCVSLGDGLIVADVHYSAVGSKGDTKPYVYTINGLKSDENYATEAEALAECENEIHARVCKMMRQLGMAVPVTADAGATGEGEAT